jgi:hypothetical protein
MTKTLDLGCGDRPRNPFHADALFGVDVRSNLGGTIRSADLAIEPIPFDDNSFDYLTAYDFLEHVPRVIYVPGRRNAFVELMNEAHRVLKPGGLFLAQTPAYPHAVAFRDPTHVNIITDETFPLYFDDQNRWASIYGFNGSFKILLQEWRGANLLAVLQKLTPPDAPPLPALATQRISVFIPVHNGERFLAKTLDSVLAQTDRDFEVLCIDDSSTDGSAQILREYAARDNRIRLLTTPHNLGSAPKSLNYALPHMTGAYFVYSSQDDLFSPDWLAKMRARALETGADAVIPDVVFHYEDDPAKDHALVGLAGDRSAILSGPEACQRTLDWSIPGNALLNAALVRLIGFEEFAINSDEYSVRRIFLQCNKVVFSEGRFFYRQDNPQAVTKRLNAATFDWPCTQLRIAQLLQENGFNAEVVGKEINGAIAAMANLRPKLEAERANWSPDEVERAQEAIKRFEDRLHLEQVFGHPQERPHHPQSKFVAKWKNSFRKRKSSLLRLAGKLGLG